MGVFGRVFDMMLQIKSISIAMATYESVLRAVNGADIVRTNNYQQHKLLSEQSLTVQESQAVAANQLNLAAMEYTRILEIQGHKINMAEHTRAGILSREQVLNDTIQERNVLLDRQVLRMTEYATLQATATAMAEAERNGIRTKIAMENVLTNNQRLRLNENIVSIEKELAKEHLLAIQLERKIDARHSHFNSTKTQNQILLNQTNATINNNESVLQQMKRMRIEDDLAILMKEEHISVDSRVQMLNNEIIMQMEVLGMNKRDLVFLTMEEIKTLNLLVNAKNDVTEAEQMAIINKRLLAIEERKLLLGIEQQTVAVHRMGGAWNSVGMMAGVLSMGIGMLGHHLGITDDAAHSMRISMILMAMSMIPAVIQMGVMTAQMMGIKTMADLAAFSIMGMNAALSVTLILTGVGAVLVLTALAIGSLVRESTDAIVAVDGMNSALSNTASILKEMSGEDATNYAVPDALLAQQKDMPKTFDLTSMSLMQFNQAIAFNRQAMNALKEDQEIYAQDDPFYAMIQNDINALNEFENVLKQGAIAQFGEQIAGR